MSCFDDAQPTNPISQVVLDLLGGNFFPPFDANFQPHDAGKITQEKLLQMQLPGGGKLKPIGDPKHSHISEYLTPLTGMLSSAFAFFGPIFIILDVIRAIIDIICAMFNPVPMIVSIVELFVNVLPPLIALFPPLSSILLALNTVKLVVAIIGSLVAALVPIIAKIVECGASVVAAISAGNPNAIEVCELLVCQLLQEFKNQLGGLLPISFILELLEIFTSLGAKFFCAADAACCNTDNCPPIIINAPGGRAVVSNVVDKIEILGRILLQPEVHIELLTAISLENINGLTSAVGVGYHYSSPERDTLVNYIVDPDKIPEDNAATIRIRITADDGRGETTLFPVVRSYQSGSGIRLVVHATGFELNEYIKYVIEPDEIALIKMNRIGLGCQSDIKSASEGLGNFMKSDLPAVPVVGGTGSTGLESLVQKTGRHFPALPLKEFDALFAAISEDPSTAVDPLPILTNYLAELADYGDAILCVGASSIKSVFSTSKKNIVADGGDFTVLSLQIKDLGGNNLLVGGLIPGSNFKAQFISSIGTIGPTTFDDTTGSFTAALTSIESGNAEITASFIVRDQVCTRIASFDGFNVSPQIETVRFVQESEAFPRIRKKNEYVQSRGGRSRR